jgi:hypothetical protein
MTLGMNLGSLTKIIKCANNDDSCKLSASEDADTLNLQFQGKSESAADASACMQADVSVVQEPLGSENTR